MNKVVVGGVYRHFKGDSYKVLMIAKNSENLKDLVVYQSIKDEKLIWVRDYDEFISKVDKEKYPNTKFKYRFELLE